MARSKKSQREVPGASDYQILHKPVITEKTSIANEGGNCVVFRVAKGATKQDVKKAVERVVDVDVVKVRTCNFMGKLKRTTRSVGRRASYKKAYVTLKQGQSIDMIEGL